MNQWYYVFENEKKGPVFESELIDLFKSGKLSINSLVWTREMKDWVPAVNVIELVKQTNSPPPLPVFGNENGIKSEQTCSQVRPWVRYWARLIDILILAFFLGGILGILYPSVLEISENLLGVLMLLIYVFIEPAMVASWGATPGKAIFKIRVRKSDGTNLNYNEALVRSFKVYILGLGLGLPIVSLITNIFAYVRLTKEGITSWDEQGNFKVTHQIIGVWPIIFIFLLFIFFIFIMALGLSEMGTL
tara:strand:+ start:613 stop:1353 length:741 start_codon:yes stop_codon:yes gene_type:complete